MEKNKLNKLTKEKLIEIIKEYEEKIAVSEECREILRVSSMQ